MEITENLGEFQKFIDSDSKTGLCQEDTLKFDKQRIFGQFESVKQSGIRASRAGSLIIAIRRGFEFDYVLFARIESFRTKGIKLIAMVKMETDLCASNIRGSKTTASAKIRDNTGIPQPCN